MSKVTDRLDNKQIIELAKQQYEQNKKTSKFPANIINLPSQGNVYEKSSPPRVLSNVSCPRKTPAASVFVNWRCT